MKKLALLILLLVQHGLYGQSMFTKYLSAPVTDADYIVLMRQQEYLSTHNFASPWLRELEFRLRSKDIDPGLEEYRIRLGLINPLEIRANKVYKQMLDKQMAANEQKLLNDLMLNRYHVLIEYHYLSGKDSLLTQRKNELSNQQQAILDTKPDLKDLIALEDQITKIELEQAELSEQFRLIQQTISRSVPGNYNTSSKLVTAKQVVDHIDTLTTQGYLVKEALRDLELKMQMQQIKKAEAFSNMGFVQGEYDKNRGNEVSEHLGFQVGLRVPIFNRDKPDLQRRELGMIDDQVKVETISEQEAYQRDQIISRMLGSYEQYRLLVQREEKLKQWLELYDQLSAEIDTYLKISEFRYFLQERKLEYYSDLLSGYLEVLHLGGWLSQSPMQNYLNADKEYLSIE